MHILKFSVLLKFEIINFPRKSIIKNNNDDDDDDDDDDDLEVVHPQSGLLLLLKYTYILHVC